MKPIIAALESELGDQMISGDAAAKFETDYSIFRVKPTAVVRPTEPEQIRTVLRLAQSFGVPVTARAGGSNTGGSAVGHGIILLIDHPALGQIAFEGSEPLVRVGPSARHDALQRALRSKGRWLPSDPSSGPLSRIGGNIATRASGPHALRHGSIARYLRHVSFFCADGTHVSSESPDSLPTSIRTDLHQIARQISDDTQAMDLLRAHEGEKWASGLDLLALVEAGDRMELALPRLLCGSVGALGILTGALLEPEPVPAGRVAVQIAFVREVDACRAALQLRRSADAVEFLSRESIALLREHTNTLVDTSAEALLIAEFSKTEANPYPAVVAEVAKNYDLVSEPVLAVDEEQIDEIWKARKALLPTIQRICRATGRHAYSVVNDVGVPPERLPELLVDLRAVFKKYSLEVAIYGHAGSGNLHLRPLFNECEPEALFRLAQEIYGRVTALGGFVTAEHGLGPLRTPFLGLEWSPQIIGYMRRVKSIFDPNNLLNPDALLPRSGESQSAWALPVDV